MTVQDRHRDVPSSGPLRTAGRVVLAAFLGAAGVAHLAVPEPFLAQVPRGLPAPEVLVLVSGLVEIALAAALLGPRRFRERAGWAAAAWFVVIFPGNLSQALTATPAFGLESDAARWGRLAFQPLFVVWALWSTGAWRWWRDR